MSHPCSPKEVPRARAGGGWKQLGWGHVAEHCSLMAVASTADRVSRSWARATLRSVCAATTGTLARWRDKPGALSSASSGLDCSAAAGASFLSLGLGTGSQCTHCRLPWISCSVCFNLSYSLPALSLSLHDSCPHPLHYQSLGELELAAEGS